ncbi:hypothetical protein [Streptosporangium sp. NBC_01495]|uniref:hypothetical protein n=1 Tax=Streptosporangium sp. NBC_01495 TaxID=2903899 RepID=UPI003FCEC64A
MHVAGGAYPRIARDLGTGEPPGTGSAMVATGHEVFHDPSPAAPARPSPPEPVPAAVAGAPGLGSGGARSQVDVVGPAAPGPGRDDRGGALPGAGGLRADRPP